MARINRATQKIFGSSANSTAITQFGTAKDAEPKYLDDMPLGGNPIEFLQSNSSFTTGWANSLEQDLAPFMQDSNALWYMITSQVAYLLKNGIAEYDVNTTYDKGDLAKVVQQNGTVVIYKSLQNDNLGHATNESGYWVMYSADDNLAKYEIGLPTATLGNTLLDNEIWLDGTAGDNGIVNIADYPKLYAIWGTRYGGNGTTTFGLPKILGKVLWGTNYLDNTNGTGYLESSLPNIKGSFPGLEQGYKKGFTRPDYGAFTHYAGNVSNGYSDNDTYDNDYWTFSANTYNATYQDGATVRPPSILVRWKTRYI